MSAGYFSSPWPCEDGGPSRLQVPCDKAGLNLQAGEALAATTRRTALSTMTVLGDPGQVYLLSHSALRSHLGLPTTACVEQIDPITLRPLYKSPRLAGGPMWPGGMAVHRNGDVYVVYGRYAHQLDRRCQLKRSLQLPVNEAYNSFVVLDNGLLVCKNLSSCHNAQLTVIDPDTLLPLGADVACPEPSVARLSASGNTVYVVGVRSIFRYHWHEGQQALVMDPLWRFDYVGKSSQSYGWDVVLDGHNAWFMDNGAHRYRIRMVGAGISPMANRLIRVSLTDSSDNESVDVCALAGGSITNPPLVALKAGVVLGYDSANRVLQAWRLSPSSPALRPLWRKSPFACASHMVLYPDTGEVVVNDYRRFGEEVVVLDIVTGQEKGRVRCGGMMQGVVFPSPGWGRDVYWSSMGRLARIYVK